MKHCFACLFLMLAYVTAIAGLTGCSGTTWVGDGFRYGDASTDAGENADAVTEDVSTDGAVADAPPVECESPADCVDGNLGCTGHWECALGRCAPRCDDCTDDDGDGYGAGAGCIGTDCDDTNVDEHPSAPELCNGTDDDCDGAVDEDLGQLSCGTGLCARTVEACEGGIVVACVPGVAAPEACGDGLDNNCDAQVDEGCVCSAGDTQSCFTGALAMRGVGVCTVGTQTCSGGSWGPCLGEGVPSSETCDGLDNNCDAATDEGNPGGGASCGLSGDCRGVTDCAGGSLRCQGTFVAPPPVGAPTNGGGSTEPLDTINAAIAKAVLLGDRANVCVAGGAGVFFDEDITMVEGVSLLGGYESTGWTRNITTHVTTIRNPTTEGVKLPAGLTAATSLDGFTITAASNPTGPSVAVTVTNGSPALVDLTMNSTAAVQLHSVGLHIRRLGDVSSSPTVTRGLIRAVASSIATGILIEGASPRVNGTSVSSMYATESTGIRCDGCVGAALSPLSVAASSGTGGYARGIWASGDLSGLTITTPSGGVISGSSGTQTCGIEFSGCSGTAPTVSGPMFVVGGYLAGGHVGILSSAPCAPVLRAISRVTGCHDNPGDSCTGIACGEDSACVIEDNSNITSGIGSVSSIGVQCGMRACSRVEGNTITATGHGSQGGVGLRLFGTTTPINDNHIVGPSCNGVASAVDGRAVDIMNGTPLLTNNVIQHRFCRGSAVEVTGGATLHSNTIVTTPCVPGVSAGVTIFGATVVGPSGPVLRNNIIYAAIASCGLSTLYGVREANPESDPSIVENNDFFGTLTGLYLDFEAVTTPLMTAVAINALADITSAAGNIDSDPTLDATWHLSAGSACIDHGTPRGAPPVDFDGDARPSGAGYDIGADEF